MFFAKFISREALLQAINFAGGICVVHALSVQEYAWYTIAVSMLGVGGILTDVGIGAALMSFAGRFWPDRSRVGALFSAALQIRRLYFICFSTLIFLTGTALLMRSDSPVMSSAAIMALVITAVYFQLNFNLISILPKLEQHLGLVQYIAIRGALMRLALLSLLFVAPSTVWAVVAALVGCCVQSFELRRRYAPVAEHAIGEHRSSIGEFKKEFFSITLKQAPGSVYYCVQGQLNILLLGFFGNAAGVAQLGALGRISALFIIAQSVFSDILMPRFSILKSRDEVLRRYCLYVGIFFVLACGFLAFAYWFPESILFLLGEKYESLSHELLLMLASASVSLIAGLLFSLNMSRAWVSPSWMQVVITVGLQALYLNFFPVNTVPAAVIFSSIGPLVSVGVYGFFAMFYLGKMA
ncbi:hypothetical protein [Paraburkholderia hospita]|uniref:hypothetical protein n=1 Tax=Paraburkholderia hospita TaxID=169430 RepID=UPI001054EFB3|nr:hypothetical protein [Paraburkholderia hospita]